MSRVVAAVIAGTLAGTLLSPALAAAPLADQVVVRTYDEFGVAPRELETAIGTARAILGDAAIDLVWRGCGPCDEPPGPRELIVRIVVAPARVNPESLGYSVVDVQQRSGRLATILADRVEAMATAASFDPGVLLGRTIAHELAHLLIGTTGHSAHGLMRAHWNTGDLERDLQLDWVLSRDEGTRMRRGLAASARRPRVPGMVAAASVEDWHPADDHSGEPGGDGEPTHVSVAGSLAAGRSMDPGSGILAGPSPTCSSSL
jgi:hypothetical protein